LQRSKEAPWATFPVQIVGLVDGKAGQEIDVDIEGKTLSPEYDMSSLGDEFAGPPT
jgi:hypothetical protein